MSRIAIKSFVPPITFTDLVAATEHAHRDAIITGDVDCVEEIKEHLDWILVNAAANRYGRQLIAKIGAKRVKKIQTELLS